MTASEQPIDIGPAVEVRSLRKSYGTLEAVRGVDFRVERGEVFALLGPNGAGKTTIVEILEGHRERTAGEVTVLGHDPQRHERGFRERIGIVLQQTGIDDYLTVREAVEMVAGYYPHPRDVGETLETAGLGDLGSRRIRKLSGGQKRRVDLALALVGRPELLFLDEPTTGFDPSARRQAWETIRGLAADGTTIFLTTHFMDEAHVLADRLAIIAEGQIVATGTADELIGARSATSRIRFRLRDGMAPPDDLGATQSVDAWELETTRPAPVLHRLTGWSMEAGAELLDLEVSRPSLEDVYLQLTAEEAALE